MCKKRFSTTQFTRRDKGTEMKLRQITMTTFVLLQATWLGKNSCQLIERLKPSHVIVQSHDPQDAYYLFSAQEALILFSYDSGLSSVRELLRLSERSTTLMVDS